MIFSRKRMVQCLLMAYKVFMVIGYSFLVLQIDAPAKTVLKLDMIGLYQL